MRRRDFIKIIAGSAVAWPLAAHTQQRPTKIPRIGIIDDAPIWDHFRRGLQEAGYVEGRDITIEYRSSAGEPGQLAAVAADLANLSLDVIVTYGSAPTRAAQQATTTTPIVMIAVGDPIKAGFAQNLARPGRNITGNTILGTEMAAKRVQLLKQLIPSVSRVAFLWNPNNASHLAYLEEWRAAGPILGVEPMFVEVGHPDQLEPSAEHNRRPLPHGTSRMDHRFCSEEPAAYALRREGKCGCGRTDVIRPKHRRSVSARGWVRAQNPARQQTHGLAGGAADQI